MVLDSQIIGAIALEEFYIATWGIAPRPTKLTTIDPINSYQSVLSIDAEKPESTP